MKLIVIVFAIQAVIRSATCQLAQIPCPIEYVYGTSTASQQTAFVWSTKDRNGIYPSTPQCLDINYNIVMRRCEDGSWFPKHVNNCYNFECPKDFVGFNQDKCYYQLAPEGACPGLDSILAQLRHGSDFETTAPLSPYACAYDVQEFLNPSLTAAPNRISVVFSFVKKLHLTVNFPEVLAANYNKAIRCYSGKVDLTLKINRKVVGLRQLYRSSITSGPSKNYSVFELDIEDHPTEYWCHIYEIGQVRPITTQKVVAYKRKTGNEYTLRVAIKGSKNGISLIQKVCPTCRLMEVLSSVTKLSEYVLHFEADATDDIPTQFATLKADLEARFGDPKTVQIVNLKSNEFCLPQNDAWNLTPMGSVALPPHAACLDSNGNPIGRKCQGSFLYGADWEEEKPCTSKKAQLPETTKLLSNISSSRTVDFKALSNAVSTPDDFTSLDVALAADCFKRAQADSPSDFLKAIANVMSVNRRVLEASQKYYGAVDKILDRIDEVLVEKNVEPITDENLSVVTMRPFKDDVVGAAFYKHDRVRHILKNQTMRDLPLENLEAMVVAPPELLEALARNLSREKKEELQIVVSAFNNEEAEGTRGRVINVAIPGFRTYWFDPTKTFVRPAATTSEIDYGFWDYERGIFNTEMVYSGFAHPPPFPPPPVVPIYELRNIAISTIHNRHLIITSVLIFLWHYFFQLFP